MIIKQNQEKNFNIIKVISTVLIASAIAWELANIYATLVNQKMPSNLNFIFWLGRFALVAHLIEAIIAGVYASSKGKAQIEYATYTFFVGIVGLLELFREKDKNLTNH
jgi:tellurite resistance protein TehA-like permease